MVSWLVAAGCMAALVACGSMGAAVGAPDGATSNGRFARAAAVDWPTFNFDAQRDGVDPQATGIGAGNLRSLRLRVVRIPGTVDASAIELHGLRMGGRVRDAIFVTTTYGRTLAIDPGTGTILWRFTPRDIGSYAGSSQVTTATPVADPDRRWIYAASPNGFIHKLSATTGREVHSRHWPARVTFDATREKIASALNLSGGSVIVVTGGYIGDAPTYQGHLVLIDRASGRVTHVFNSLCSNRHGLIDPPDACSQSDSAIWGRAGAVVEPGSGRLLIATGNGDFNGYTDWGDSVLELSPTAQLLHNWTPRDQQQLNDGDTDIGSSSPALLPPVGGWHLVVQGSKDTPRSLHVLNLTALDGTTGPAGPRLGGEIENVQSPGGDQIFTAPAVWSHGGQVYVFVADGSGTTAYLARGGARPGLSVAWQNGNSGTSPVLAGGLLYVYDPGGSLDVYNPVTGTRLDSLNAAGGHWNSPIVLGGRIIEPVGAYGEHSTTGEIYIWHLPGR
jgi:outer membrane protein assembly factor BamB